MRTLYYTGDDCICTRVRCRDFRRGIDNSARFRRWCDIEDERRVRGRWSRCEVWMEVLSSFLSSSFFSSFASLFLVLLSWGICWGLRWEEDGRGQGELVGEWVVLVS